MKLELKHIAPYLPYGLQVISDYEQFTLVGYDVLTDICKIQYDKSKLVFSESIYSISPILRPISDLYISCLDGELTPMIELAKMLFNNYLNVYNSLSIDRVKHIEIFYKVVSDKVVVYEESDAMFEMMFHKILNGFVAWNLYDETILPVTNQLQLFQQLFEWHFDVFNLIENGLAIDINTLQCPPANPAEAPGS